MALWPLRAFSIEENVAKARLRVELIVNPETFQIAAQRNRLLCPAENFC